MAVWIILVTLVVLFQEMKLLPTGRKNLVAIFVYSSIVGLGSFLLRYLPGLLHSVLTEMGISEDMYNPVCKLAMFLLVFIVLAGAWLGFWVVCKRSIRIIASVMILQSFVDPLMTAVGALLCGVVVSFPFRITRTRFIRHLYNNWGAINFINLWRDYVKRQTRFVSRQPAKLIISTIEAVAESMGLKVHTHYKGGLKLGGFFVLKENIARADG